MLTSSPQKLNKVLIGITFTISLLLLLVRSVPFEWQLVFFVLLMVLTGIPHGAVDHVVYQKVEKNKQVSTNYLRFFMVYLGIILLYALLWYLLPQLCLVVFFLVSFYHFGQSQLYYLKWPERKPFKIWIYLCWGALVICGIMYFNYQASAEVLEAVVLLPDFLSLATTELIWLVLIASILVSFAIAYHYKKLSLSQLLVELISLALLMGLFYAAPLLIAFAVYFGLWHSLKAIQAELKYFKERKNTLKWFYKQAWPFSLLSFMGITLLLIGGQYLAEHISPYLLFFITISLLTMPHMYYMQKLYTSSGHKK